MKASVSCPICGGEPKVVSIEVFGWHACCSQCYDEDPEEDTWRHIQGVGETPEDAVDFWLEDAREFCALELPPLHIPYRLNYSWRDLAVQVIDEAERQRGWVEEWTWLDIRHSDRHDIFWGPA